MQNQSNGWKPVCFFFFVCLNSFEIFNLRIGGAGYKVLGRLLHSQSKRVKRIRAMWEFPWGANSLPGDGDQAATLLALLYSLSAGDRHLDFPSFSFRFSSRSLTPFIYFPYFGAPINKNCFIPAGGHCRISLILVSPYPPNNRIYTLSVVFSVAYPVEQSYRLPHNCFLHQKRQASEWPTDWLSGLVSFLLAWLTN